MQSNFQQAWMPCVLQQQASTSRGTGQQTKFWKLPINPGAPPNNCNTFVLDLQMSAKKEIHQAPNHFADLTQCPKHLRVGELGAMIQSLQ